MKLLILLLFPLLSFAQLGTGKHWQDRPNRDSFRFVSVSVDPANAIWGSDKNPPGLDIVARVGARTPLNFQAALFYERFSLIAYHSYGVQASYIWHYSQDIKLITGTELSAIARDIKGNYESYAFHAGIEYHFNHFFMGLRADLKRRPDIAQDWCYSNYVELGFKF